MSSIRTRLADIYAPQTPMQWGMLVGVIVLTILHFVSLHWAPPALYTDEFTTASNLARELTDFDWPFFIYNGGGGYTTPTYLYPLLAWGSLFGITEFSLRAFSVVLTIAAIFFTGLSMRLLLHKSAMYAAWIIGLSLPWAWLQGSLVWDPAMVPLWASLALFFFALSTREDKHRRLAIYGTGLALILMAYTYPPARLVGPLLLLAALLYWTRQRHITWIALRPAIITWTIVSLPLLLFMVTPTALWRSAELSVFNTYGPFGGLWALIVNIVGLINPVFLFFTGDPNLRHSTGFQGMLGWASIVALLAGGYFAWRYRKSITQPAHFTIVVACVGIFASIIGSALTSEGQPHSLRASSAWPFFVVLITLAWLEIWRHHKRWMPVYIGFTIIATGLYVDDLIMHYPARSYTAFSGPERALDHERIQNGDSDIDIYYRVLENSP